MSFWAERGNALALMELLREGELRHRRGQAQAWSELLALGWARKTGRSGVLSLVPGARPQVERTLSRAWPRWREAAERLASEGLRVSPTGQAQLERRDRVAVARTTDLPERINRRTAAALVGRHAKATLGPLEQSVLEAVELTRDGLVRLRPNAGLTLLRDGVEHDATALAGLLGELALTDRALRDGTTLAGRAPRAVLTVENLGAYEDAVVSEDLLVLHLPGWNTRIARDLLGEMRDVPIVHFGDLDPNGIAILAHLRRWRPAVRWLVPEFWAEYLDPNGLQRTWSDIALPEDTPAWVRTLPERGLWLEQEVIILDPRFRDAVARSIAPDDSA